MQEFWLYILLGFFGGMIFCFLLIIGFIKRVVKIIGVVKDKDNG